MIATSVVTSLDPQRSFFREGLGPVVEVWTAVCGAGHRAAHVQINDPL